MQIIRSNWLPISAILIIVAMTLAASATDRQSSATDFDPDYPIGTPPILGGTGYVTETYTGWHNAQDWRTYNTDYSGYHPGEDWNYGTGTADVGKPVYAIAAGTVVDTRDALFNDKSGYGSGIAIEHTLPSGEKIYSVYEHIDIASGLSIGDPVWQGDRIGCIADTSKLSPHLHFEIRTKQVDTEDWYPNDNGYGYYASEEKLRADGFTVDPSDFIDSHRSTGGSVDAGTASQVTLTLHVHDGNAEGPIIPGATVTGQDASNNRFEETTNSDGYVTITGDPGKWSFSASADGYETNNWDQEITKTDTKDAFLLKVQQSSEVEVKNHVQSTAQNVSSVSENSASGEFDDLINALKDKDAGVRLKAAEALGKLGDARAVDSLIEVLRNEETWDVRQMAAWALGQIDDPRVVDPLSYASVKDADSNVREEAYNALQKSTVGGNKVDARSVDPIIEALKDEDQGVRKRAAEALGKLKNATAVDSLIEVLRNEETWDVREMAAWALGEIGDARAIDPLNYASMKDAHGNVRGEAKKALGKLGMQVE